ncbi:threonine ammonia-lyase [Pandoraea terrae]|nr:threonine/serine dehydratase [Pandoraea terrae]
MEDIRQAADRLGGSIVRTPVLASPMLDAAAGCRVFVKAEPLQLTGSFKIRGAMNKMLTLGAERLRRGVITYSAGNHGQGVAAGARLLGCPAVIVLPDTAPAIKVENCRWWGAEIVFYSPDTQDRETVTVAIARERGMTFIPPFDDIDVMAGQGTLGLELVEQLAKRNVVPDVVLVNCSGGGLASGVITAIKHAFAHTQCYVVEPTGFEKMGRSLRSGRPEHNPTVPKTLMDAISGPVVGALPLRTLLTHDVRGISVTDDEALQAVAHAFRWLKLVVEPGGAAGLAAVLARKVALDGKRVALVCSGGNVDPAVYARALTHS